VFELVKPAAENEEVGVMKNEPADVELEVVAFQVVEVSVVMSQVIADRVLGKEVESAIYASPGRKVRLDLGTEKKIVKYRPRFHIRVADQKCWFRRRRWLRLWLLSGV